MLLFKRPRDYCWLVLGTVGSTQPFVRNNIPSTTRQPDKPSSLISLTNDPRLPLRQRTALPSNTHLSHRTLPRRNRRRHAAHLPARRAANRSPLSDSHQPPLLVPTARWHSAPRPISHHTIHPGKPHGFALLEPESALHYSPGRAHDWRKQKKN
jgi:hypothetical protein